MEDPISISAHAHLAENSQHLASIDTVKASSTMVSHSEVLTPTTPSKRLNPGEETEIDENIKNALPSGLTVLAATAYGCSNWTQTFKIITENEEGEEKGFFLKTASGELGETMFRGEFESMTAINTIMPDFSPKPIAWGQCRDDSNLFFFLATFVEMLEGELPDPKEFCKNLAKLHRQSVSPTGKYGFHVTTCNGNIPQNNTWDESWERFFSNGLRHMLALDIKANGEQPELMDAIQPIFDCVIPRLLGPLEKGPNAIRPSLVHGDLWYGNCSTNLDTDSPVIFDAAAFYAHNEYELGNWRPTRNRLKNVHLAVYKQQFTPAHPRQEFDDRIMLYELRFNFHFCIMVSGLKDIKAQMIHNMRYLAEKYPSAEFTE